MSPQSRTSLVPKDGSYLGTGTRDLRLQQGGLRDESIRLHIRNLAVIGHGDAGKTQLVSSLLHVAGATTRWGKVDEGTTITDYEEDSIERKVSLNNNFAHLEYKDTKINLIDTPGYAAFVSHARPALRVADCALVVVDGVHGIEVQTEKTWQYANEFLLPRFMVINKIDKEHADFGHALETATSSFARSIVPFTLPIGREGDFKGVSMSSQRLLVTSTEGDG